MSATRGGARRKDRALVLRRFRYSESSLVVHGLADTRVPTGQSYELYRALKHLGVPTQLVMYPREGHGISENVHGLDFANRFVGWFDEYVKGE